MPDFKPGVKVTTKKPVVVVNAGLKPGMHRFQLVIVTRKGAESPPSIHSIRVLEPPVRRRRSVDTNKEPVPNPRSKPKARGTTQQKPGTAKQRKPPASPAKDTGKTKQPKPAAPPKKDTGSARQRTPPAEPKKDESKVNKRTRSKG
jgi:hypothetical protein